ncbi:hypothetical protein FNF27_05128 [Cafeteria roenbergensis]|uniref:IMS import disulfide relay-system CHCH-CHCH-like Cx9C domain-containing protein n=1 Tax=Cafeteria roenbergensis TaxID=33653 RepID=A0A5A8EBW1_CAFRO|nr:hypothetical protein FNF29_07481 [Cafeteria roenbergensis]KAA0165870.1 hypothetical protein FNF28_03375 [Cafeteria roenbergensis]KAA0173351.1 hypothetical protein FNF27_05128 [Cafeteria roenbergensis]|mmetsp:Transcript_7618/g.30159  ORF Transcript_7618/g.30159 Transcript_7618/m.30159 type:complete len:116 (+) Transcript_7618:89-436(+)|eukprot:KAA0147220.1 hypothetical protein FNF29_07481 [Cafeteria roenbergensis]
MPKRGSRGFRWADLAPEHQKAVSHFTASGGTFPYYEPCFEQTEAFSSCLKHNDFEPVMCHKEKMALTACIDTKPMFDYKLMRKARRKAKVSMRASLLSVLKEHPRTLKSVLRGGK